ncbi:MAG: iron-containing alcohol dehydrogenase [Kiritimatiellae bacterium]|nr:iron-containing alcohol dehydrogenase [Kiritimatiellia bacterium]
MLPNPLLLPARTLTGEGCLLRLPEAVREFGQRGVIVHGRALLGGGRLAQLLAAFPSGAQIRAYRHAGGEPTLDEVESLRGELRRDRPDWVAAVGGGSVLDLAKAAAGLADAPATAADYQSGTPIPTATLPFVAVPTTAGTGSEATVVAVLTDSRRNLKQSIRHPSFMPRVVILDPLLLHDCPRATLAAAGLDALTQAYESLVSRYATPFTRALSELALKGIVESLPPMFDGDRAAAPRLLESSYLAGLALSHARLGVVHGLAHPLGARWHAAHGLVCACCLPAALRFNAAATAGDMARLKQLIGQDFAELIETWLRKFGLTSPFKGTPLRETADIVRETLASGSTAANPRPVTGDDVIALLREIF